MKSIEEKIEKTKESITSCYDMGIDDLKELAPALWENKILTFDEACQAIMDAYYLGVDAGQRMQKNAKG